ncbi:hypothetical protein N7451_009452 [Penicillium sp. IBT 35674x]|nr:hypothetical protein N7451_009452 [Penicillium sp. IBT 35674x]
MIIEGEKWACEACVRGHRVSSCHHGDRPLTHINKKGRPVSQCTHCRGLRKSRTTHVRCECGDKKKKSDSDCHGEKRDLKDSHRCGCCHGQRCTCALKKESHLDPVPEAGLPVSLPSVPAEPTRKPLLTTTKSESTLSGLTIFRDVWIAVHNPTITYYPPSVRHASQVGRPSSVGPIRLCSGTALSVNGACVQVTTDIARGIPQSAPASGSEEVPISASLDQSFLDKFSPPTAAMEQPTDGTANPTSAPAPMDKFPLEQIITSVPPPLDVSSFASFPNTSSNSPITCMAFQDQYQDQYFTSPDSEFPLGSAGTGAPSVDWSSFPLYSDAPATTSTQAPSYASFDYKDYNSYPSGLPPPSSSGDISEVDEFGPLPGLGHANNDMHDLHSVSEASELDHLRISSASSLVGLPQARLLSSNDLESINIDDFLKSANESTAALEHQLQASMGIESKSMPAQDMYSMAPSQDTIPTWPANLFNDESTPPLNDDYFRQSWTQ